MRMMNVDNENECIDVRYHRLCSHQLSCVAEDVLLARRKRGKPLAPGCHANSDDIIKNFGLEQRCQLLKVLDDVQQPQAEERHRRSEVANTWS